MSVKGWFKSRRLLFKWALIGFIIAVVISVFLIHIWLNLIQYSIPSLYGIIYFLYSIIYFISLKFILDSFIVQTAFIPTSFIIDLAFFSIVFIIYSVLIGLIIEKKKSKNPKELRKSIIITASVLLVISIFSSLLIYYGVSNPNQKEIIPLNKFCKDKGLSDNIVKAYSEKYPNGKILEVGNKNNIIFNFPFVTKLSEPYIRYDNGGEIIEQRFSCDSNYFLSECYPSNPGIYFTLEGCYLDVATFWSNISICDKISYANTHEISYNNPLLDYCYRDVAISLRNISICEKINDGYWQGYCYVKIKGISDSKDCLEIENDKLRNSCVRYI